jgi:hypothetical protein
MCWSVWTSTHASVTHIMINHKYWPILIYDNSHITGIIHFDQFYEWISGWLRFIVGHTPELKSRHTFLCTENTQAIGFSLANYGLYRQSIYVALNIYCTGVWKKSSFVENSYECITVFENHKMAEHCFLFLYLGTIVLWLHDKNISFCFKARTNKFGIYRQCICIVYLSLRKHLTLL